MHEDLLRHLWSKQLFDPQRLVTSDGRAVRVFSPGDLSRQSGPDFLNARIEIGGVLFTGDVEFHRTAPEWETHGHHRDPAFNGVILHVVVTGPASDAVTQSGRIIPAIVLEEALTKEAVRYRDHLAREEYSSKKDAIPCAGINNDVDPALIEEWIRLCYRERLRERVSRFHLRLAQITVEEQRAFREPEPHYHRLIEELPLPDDRIDPEMVRRRLPWEQLLYERIMDALGYSRNRAPMLRLAEKVSLSSLHRVANDRSEPLAWHELEALMLLAAGLLPTVEETEDQSSRIHVHALRSAVNGLPYTDFIPFLRASEWNFSPTRPANFPGIRIAAAAFIAQRILQGTLFRSIIAVIGGRFTTVAAKRDVLIGLLSVDEHPYWSHHYAFGEPVLQPHALLGRSRILDIIVNVIIPFTALYAAIFGQDRLAEHCLTLAEELPLLETNTLLRRMERDLLKQRFRPSCAMHQQGLLQIAVAYCAKRRCDECMIGRTLTWPATGSGRSTPNSPA